MHVWYSIFMQTFRHSHSLGQNFLTDKNLLAAIVTDAGITNRDTVIEVGAGMGALTRPLAESGARVFAFEIDERLKEYLEPFEKQYDGLKLIFGDFMKSDINEITGGARYKAVANLPYYITTPVLFRFLEDPLCDGVTVMVQKEVAERITASAGGKDYGALSVAAQMCGRPRITRIVGRNLFTPPPNVDSAVVNIRLSAERPDESVRRVVRAAFSMRRKTLVNCLTNAGYAKDKALSALSALSLPPDVRGERLTPMQFTELAELI